MALIQPRRSITKRFPHLPKRRHCRGCTSSVNGGGPGPMKLRPALGVDALHDEFVELMISRLARSCIEVTSWGRDGRDCQDRTSYRCGSPSPTRTYPTILQLRCCPAAPRRIQKGSDRGNGGPSLASSQADTISATQSPLAAAFNRAERISDIPDRHTCVICFRALSKHEGSALSRNASKVRI